MEFKRLEEEQRLEIEVLREENRRKLAETKLHELEQKDDASQTSQYLSMEISQTSLDDDTKSKRVEQWVNGWTSQCDQSPLSDDIEAQEETRAGVTESDNQPQWSSTSNEYTFFQT